MPRDHVGQAHPVLNGCQRAGQLHRKTIVELDVLFEHAPNAPGQHVQLRVDGRRVFLLSGRRQGDPGPEALLPGEEGLDPGPTQSLHHHTCRTVRKVRLLKDPNHGADGVQVLLCRLDDSGIPLRHQKKEAVAFLRRLQGGYGGCPADEEREDHVWEEDQIPEGDDGKLFGDLCGSVDPVKGRH